MRGGGELGSCRVSDNEKVVHRSPNKLWRSHFILLLFLLHGTEFRVVFSSTEGFGTEFRDFLFRGIAGIPSEITLCSVYSVFRGIIFLSEIPNPSLIPASVGTVESDEAVLNNVRKKREKKSPPKNFFCNFLNLHALILTPA